MNIFKLSYKNILSRPLNTLLSLMLLTLGVGMISLVLQLRQHMQAHMENNISGIDMVIGAKGSPLQQILSAVFQIDAPTGNIPLHEAEELAQNRLIDAAIPLAYGDSYNGYRIVGSEYSYPELYGAKPMEGRLWKEPFEVTLGANLAKRLELSVGDSFHSSHGLSEQGESHDEHPFEVVGVFEKTNSVMDNLILTSIESVWDVHDHEHSDAHDDYEEEEAHDHHDDHRKEHHEHDSHEEEHDDHHHPADHEEEHVAGEAKEHEESHDDEKELTAMLVSFKSPVALVQLPRMVNEGTSMQAAVPIYEINRLFGLMGVGVDTLNTIALVILIAAGLSLFISLYSTFKDRQYEMAFMRSCGASRWQLAQLVLQEALILSISGFALGIAFSRLGLWLTSQFIAPATYSLSAQLWIAEEWILLAASLVLGLLAALLPALRVFYINISKTLSDA